MRISLKASIAGMAAVAALGISAQSAWAGCADTSFKPAAWDQGRTLPVDAGLIRVASPTSLPSIVGLWSVEFHAGGKVIDFGYAEWHSDGTEIMNSGGRAPATGNFCLGVWAQTGALSYSLNHFALSYDQTSGALNAKINIKENVTLGANGSGFNGPFSIDAYDPETGALLQHVAGFVVGRRVTAS